MGDHSGTNIGSILVENLDTYGIHAKVQYNIFSIDGQAATYTYAGGVADVVEGLMQLNVQIPATVRSGDLGVVVSIGGVPSQSGVTVSVQ